MQKVGVKFYICLTEVYVIKDNINAFNKTLNKPSKAVSLCWTRIMRFCRTVLSQINWFSSRNERDFRMVHAQLIKGMDLGCMTPQDHPYPPQSRRTVAATSHRARIGELHLSPTESHRHDMNRACRQSALR